MNKLTTLFLLCWLSFSLAQTPLTNTFTYQGELKMNNALANGTFDFEFKVFDVQTGGVALETVTVSSVTVTNGVFSTPITLTNDLFMGNKIWLDIGVKTNGSGNPFDPLSPRQEVTSTPYAIHAQFVGADAVTGVQIQNGTVTLNDMHSNSVDSNTIVDGSITSTDIAADAITDVELANNAVDTLALQDNAVTSVKIADGSVSSVDILDGNIGSVDIDSTQVQLRGAIRTCPSGEYLVGISQAGNVICQVLPRNRSNLVDIVDALVYGTQGAVSSPSIVVNSRNLPVISYFIGSTTAFFKQAELKVLTCLTANCSNFNPPITLSTISSGLISMGNTKVVVSSSNFPLIFYNESGALKLIACTSDNCTSFNPPVLLDIGLNVNFKGLDVVIGTDGLPVVSYIASNAGVRELRLIKCSQQDCSTFNRAVVIDNNIDTGAHVSVIVGANGMPQIAYQGIFNNGNIYVATCTSLDCVSFSSVRTAYTIGGDKISLDMILNNNDQPIIAVSEGGVPNSLIFLITCDVANCSSITNISSVIDSGGWDMHLYVDANNRPFITHYDADVSTLKMVKCYDATCDNVASKIVIESNVLASGTSSIVNQSGLPIFAYYYALNNNNSRYLKVFSCGNASCQ